MLDPQHNPAHDPRIFGQPPAGDLVDAEIYQHYNDTCAIRSQQIIMRDFGIDISQEELMEEAWANGWYTPSNGTPADDVGKLLEVHNIPVSRYDNANVYQLVNELASGKRIIVGVDSGELTESSILRSIEDMIFGQQPDHALIVAGIDTTDIDNVQVVLTDPGTGHVAKAYPLDQFLDAWADSGNMMVVTDDPAPASAPGMENFDYDTGRVEVHNDAFQDWLDHIFDRMIDKPLPTMEEIEAQYGHGNQDHPVLDDLLSESDDPDDGDTHMDGDHFDGSELYDIHHDDYGFDGVDVDDMGLEDDLDPNNL